LVAVEQTLARHRVAHGLEHHLQEQALELLCGGALSLRIVTLDLGLEGGQGIDVEDGRDRRGGAHDGSEHADRRRSAIGRENRQKLPSSDKAAQITSSSARRAPEAFIAWRMAIKSCGLAPSAFSALTISARLALLRMFCMALSSWLISIWALVTGAVWPPAKALGWLMALLAFTDTDRLPCATAQFSSCTAWFMTTEPVRLLTMTLAAICTGRISRFSRRPMKATRSSLAVGARTRTMRPSTAAAAPGETRLMASTTRWAVPKSVALSSKWTKSPWPSRVG